MAEIRVQIPDALDAEMRERVAAGEFADCSELLREALRYYLDRHRPEDWEEYVRKEIAWSRERAGG